MSRAFSDAPPHAVMSWWLAGGHLPLTLQLRQPREGRNGPAKHATFWSHGTGDFVMSASPSPAADRRETHITRAHQTTIPSPPRQHLLHRTATHQRTVLQCQACLLFHHSPRTSRRTLCSLSTISCSRNGTRRRSTNSGRPRPSLASGSKCALLPVSESKRIRLRFRSLKNHGVDEDVNKMFEMGAETMRLPLDEKMKYEQGDAGMSSGRVPHLFVPVSVDVRQSR